MKKEPEPINLASGVSRDFASDPQVSAFIQNEEELTLEQTDEGITVIHGDREVTFVPANLGANPAWPTLYARALDNGEVAYLFQSAVNESYEHLGIWLYGRGPAGEMNVFQGPTTDEYRFIVGVGTPSMPVTGTASYAGRMTARAFLKSAEASEGDSVPVSIRSESTTHFVGAFGMSAEFSSDGTALSGRFANVRSRPGNEREYLRQVDGVMTFTAQATGSRFQTTEVKTTGPFAHYSDINIRGGFFGPEADETGGVFDGESSDRVLTGYFRAKKEE